MAADTAGVDTTGSGTSWGDWFQGVLGDVASKAATAQWVQPYEVQKLQLQALGATGGYYTEGMRTGQNGGMAMNTNTLLLLGAVLVAVVMLKD